MAPGDWWNEQGDPLHRDLLDPEKDEWVGNIPRGSLFVLAKWWTLAERFDHGGLKSLIRRLVHMSSSVDGYRSEQITRTIEGLAAREILQRYGSPRYGEAKEDEG